MSHDYWRAQARMLPALPAGRDGKPLTGDELRRWEYVQEQAARELERELQAMAVVDELHRRQEIMTWLLETKANAEREAAATEQVEPAGDSKTRRGRRPNAGADAELLQEIRDKNPKSDEWTKFKSHLTAPAPGKLPVNVDTARRRYKKAVAFLAKK